MRYSNKDLTASSCDFTIPLGEWHQSPTVSLYETSNDPTCLERCSCTISRSSFAAVDLTGDTVESDHKYAVHTQQWRSGNNRVSFRMAE